MTRREAQILGHIFAGLSNADIAARLFISPATVRKHLEQTYAKLGIRGRHEAVELFVGTGVARERPAETI